MKYSIKFYCIWVSVYITKVKKAGQHLLRNDRCIWNPENNFLHYKSKNEVSKKKLKAKRLIDQVEETVLLPLICCSDMLLGKPEIYLKCKSPLLPLVNFCHVFGSCYEFECGPISMK